MNVTNSDPLHPVSGANSHQPGTSELTDAGKPRHGFASQSVVPYQMSEQVGKRFCGTTFEAFVREMKYAGFRLPDTANNVVRKIQHKVLNVVGNRKIAKFKAAVEHAANNGMCSHRDPLFPDRKVIGFRSGDKIVQIGVHADANNVIKHVSLPTAFDTVLVQSPERQKIYNWLQSNGFVPAIEGDKHDFDMDDEVVIISPMSDANPDAVFAEALRAYAEKWDWSGYSPRHDVVDPQWRLVRPGPNSMRQLLVKMDAAGGIEQARLARPLDEALIRNPAYDNAVTWLSESDAIHGSGGTEQFFDTETGKLLINPDNAAIPYEAIDDAIMHVATRISSRPPVARDMEGPGVHLYRQDRRGGGVDVLVRKDVDGKVERTWIPTFFDREIEQNATLHDFFKELRQSRRVIASDGINGFYRDMLYIDRNDSAGALHALKSAYELETLFGTLAAPAKAATQPDALDAELDKEPCLKKFLIDWYGDGQVIEQKGANAFVGGKLRLDHADVESALVAIKHAYAVTTLSSGEFGTAFDRGAEKEAFLISRPEGRIVAGVLKFESEADSGMSYEECRSRDEVRTLNVLGRLGYPVVEIYGIGRGDGFVAVLTKYVANAKSSQRILDDGGDDCMGQKTVDGLSKTKALLDRHNIRIVDFEFLVAEDGAICINDADQVLPGIDREENISFLEEIIDMAKGCMVDAPGNDA